MAERRMFTKKVSDSDSFIDMPAAAQALYFHLNQGADDDGFNNQVQMAMWKAHASIDDLKVLMAKNFIIRFESGVIVIKHWRMHNTLRKDRYTPTNFQEELAMLGVKENEAYTLNGCQVVAKRLPQDRLGKDSIGKDSISPPIVPPTWEDSVGEKPSKPRSFIKPTVEQIREYCNERNNNVDPETFYDFYESKGWLIGKNPMKDWKAAVRTWEKGNGRGFGNSARKDEPFNVFAQIQEQERRGT